MNRRDLLILGSTAIALPLAARAQQKAMPVIGFLGSIGAIPPQMDAFHQGLSETGYVEGQNVTVEYRWAGEVMIGCPHWPPISSAARLI